jgi:hypothetical protein
MSAGALWAKFVLFDIFVVPPDQALNPLTVVFPALKIPTLPDDIALSVIGPITEAPFL